jgi:hypothetical protein
VTLVDDARVIRIRAELRVERRDARRQRVGQRIDLVRGREHVVGRDTRLTCVQELARGEPRCADVEVCVGKNESGRLAAELEGHRRQVAGRGDGNPAADRSGAGEKQVIEGQSRECLADVRAACHDGELVGGKSSSDHAFEQGGSSRRQLARLEQDAIACGKRRHRGQQRELHRIVPWTDHADHSDRLAHDPASAGMKIERRRNAARPDPAAQIAPRMPDAGEHHEQLRESRLLRGTNAEIRGDRADELLFIGLDHRAEPFEPVAARRDRRIALSFESHALRGEQRTQAVAVAAHSLTRAAVIASSKTAGS